MKQVKHISPIRSERDYENALREIDELIDSKPGTPGFDRLEVLSILTEAWEEQYHPIYTGDIDPVDVIRFWLEQNNLTRKDLEPYIGSRAKVSEVLSGKRPLSMLMIRKLVGAGIPADLLIKPILLDKAA
ncbi:MAG: Antitoxin HigA [bacterium ADurb.Bin374]|nr:MAG: Antitoxin HigA [bacterium ADurb.Bin374]